jgi:hypothetical protein
MQRSRTRGENPEDVELMINQSFAGEEVYMSADVFINCLLE